MSAPDQPVPQNVSIAYQAGWIQLGQQIFVQLNLQTGALSQSVFLPIDNAKAFARAIREAAETAEVQIIKPPSLLAQA
jgi:hypothetical protein